MCFILLGIYDLLAVLNITYCPEVNCAFSHSSFWHFVANSQVETAKAARKAMIRISAHSHFDWNEGVISLNDTNYAVRKEI